MSKLSLPEFADRIYEIMPRIIRKFALRQKDEVFTGKITPAQFLILNFLNRQGESKMTALAHFMGVSTAAMTGTVDRLVRSDHLIRVFDPHDRRIIKMKLTRKGSELVKNIYRHRRKMIMNIFGKVSQDERESYLKILMHVYNILSKEK